MTKKTPDTEQEESWLKQYWRPAIAWQYLAVCLCDFLVFPMLAFEYGVTWIPLTLREGGFYHVSMAAIIGVSAWTRGKEKIERLIVSTPTEQETK